MEVFIKMSWKHIFILNVPFSMVFSYSPYLVLNCSNPFFPFILKCRDCICCMLWRLIRFLSFLRWRLDRFKDNTLHIPLCCLVLIYICMGFVSMLYSLVLDGLWDIHVVKLDVLKVFHLILIKVLFVCKENFRFLLILSSVCNERFMWLVWDLLEVKYVNLRLWGASSR